MTDYLAAFLGDDRPSHTKQHSESELTEPTKAPSVSFVSAPSALPVAIPVRGSDHGLACREVLGFHAHLMAGLPLVATLVVEPVAGGPHRSLDPYAFTTLGSSAGLPPDATVAGVLAHHRLRLRAVVIDGGAL